MRCSACCLCFDQSSDAGLLFNAVFANPASLRLGERALDRDDFEIPAVGRRSSLLSPGIVQITRVDGIEAEIVDEAKHCCPGVQGIPSDRKGDPPFRSPRNALFEKACSENVVERLDYRTADLLSDPLSVEHSTVDRIDVAIAKIRMVVAY